MELPREFDLEIPVLQQTMPVQLMWSKGRTHGVLFLQELHGQSDGTSDGILDSIQPPETQPALEGIPKGLVSLTEDVLDDARRHLAEILELPAEKIRLKLEIDP
jgi:hypothetical protein